MGDLMGLKGHLVNFVVRKVKKMVPEWSLPGHVSSRRRCRRTRKAPSSRHAGHHDVAFPAIYRRHDRRFQGGDAA
jgi:long-chain acyl-CoA synthetase